MKLHSLQIDGLYTGVDFVRNYPNGESIEVLGLQDMMGKAWLASNMHTMNSYLEPAIKFVFIQMRKEFRYPMSTMDLKQVNKGASVELTIDFGMQKIIERELMQAMEKYDATQAIGIVMNPKTGEILALASLPTFIQLNYQDVDQSIYNRNLPVG